MTEYVFGNVRVQLLSNEIVRVEYAKKGKFCNENTFFIPDKSAFNEEVECKKYGGYVVFGGYMLTVNEGARGLSGVSIIKEGVTVYRCKKLSRPQELPSLDKTPEVFAVADSPRITVPDGGYTYRGKKKNSGYKIEENALDIYLLICGGDGKKLRRLYVELTGKKEMPRLSFFGSWNTNNHADSEEGIKNIIFDCEKNGIPVDGITIDAEYAEDKNLFPDIKRFLRFARGKNIEVIYSDRPEQVEGSDSVLSPAEVKYREQKIQSLLKLGLDGVIYDGGDGLSALKSPTEGVDPDLWGSYIYEEVTRHYFQKLAKSNEIYRRPAIRYSYEHCQLNLKQNLLPIIYKNAYISYLTGEPIFKELGYEYPNDKKALKCRDEFLLGNNILVAPYVGVNKGQCYLPAGKWLNAFEGKIYSGGKTVSADYSTNEFALFIRLGALLPLAYAADNVKSQAWNKLVYDFYPDKNSTEEGYLYEDDTETTAYKFGQFRKGAYKAYYSGGENSYNIKLFAAEGTFSGERAFLNREITLKYHMLTRADKVKKVTINGSEVPFEIFKKDGAAYPLNCDNASSDSDVLCVKFPAEIYKDTEIKFYLI